MKGFDAEFSNLDHYIRVITARIWEGRRIDDIRKYYSDPCVVETPMSVSTAMEDVITRHQGHPGHLPGPPPSGRGCDPVGRRGGRFPQFAPHHLDHDPCG